MDLLLIPVFVSFVVVCLFVTSAIVGGMLRLGRSTAEAGKHVFIYAVACCLVGLACCWTAFALVLFAWRFEGPAIRLGNVLLSLDVATMWLGGPFGMVLGAILARRFLARRRTPPADAGPGSAQPG